jgi:hypothetical protein
MGEMNEPNWRCKMVALDRLEEQGGYMGRVAVAIRSDLANMWLLEYGVSPVRMLLASPIAIFSNREEGDGSRLPFCIYHRLKHECIGASWGAYPDPDTRWADAIQATIAAMCNGALDQWEKANLVPASGVAT